MELELELGHVDLISLLPDVEWTNRKATKIEIDTVPGVGDVRDWSCCGEA